MWQKELGYGDHSTKTELPKHEHAHETTFLQNDMISNSLVGCWD